MSSVNETDYRQCSICSQLADHERGFQKLGQKDEDTYLPPAASLLKVLKDINTKSGAPHEIWRCPECTSCYLYRFEHEFLYGYGGSEDTQELTRLTTAEAAEWLKLINPEMITVSGGQTSASATSAEPKAPIEGAVMITKESVSLDTSEPGFVRILYVQLDDGLDMGGQLLLERKSVPLILALLHSCLNVYSFPEVECQCGDDAFRIYESGSDQQTVINILNRRPDGVPHEGLTGLMMTHLATQVLIEQLRKLS